MNIIIWSLFVGGILLALRNIWVYKKRTQLLYDDMLLYDLLPSYNKMMFQFWIWDIKRFIGEK